MSRRPLVSSGGRFTRTHHTNVPSGKRWSESPVTPAGPSRPLRKAAEISLPLFVSDITWCDGDLENGSGISSSSQSNGFATITFDSSELGCGVWCTPTFQAGFDGSVSDVQVRVISSVPDRETEWMPVPSAWNTAYYDSWSDRWDTGIYWGFSWNGSSGPPDTITVEVQWVGTALMTDFCAGVVDNQ